MLVDLSQISLLWRSAIIVQIQSDLRKRSLIIYSQIIHHYEVCNRALFVPFVARATLLLKILKKIDFLKDSIDCIWITATKGQCFVSNLISYSLEINGSNE